VQINLALLSGTAEVQSGMVVEARVADWHWRE